MIALNAATVRAYPDGTINGRHPAAEKIIRLLCLNSPAFVRWRRTWIRVVELAERYDRSLYAELMRYPDDLPDLRSCRATSNLHPEGIGASFHAERARGTLPDVYLT